MKRRLALIRCLMLAVMAMLVLGQTMAFAAVHEVPAAKTSAMPPCHQDAGAVESAHAAMPCCDDEDGCALEDCGVLCHRAAVQFAALPLLPRLIDATVATEVPAWPANPLLTRQRIPPLPPPILV
jgi:hypothetical protein